ncbi:putative RNA-directed DNA polymerase [Helianthus debilis subsp. tardiflorus]
MASPSSSTTPPSTDSPLPSLAPTIAIKLAPTNYLFWKTQMEPLLNYHQLMDHVDGSSVPPAKTTLVDDKVAPNPAYNEWYKLDQKAIIILTSSLTEEALATIVGLQSARDIWTTIESAFCNPSVERVQNLRDSLRTMQKGSKTVAEFGRAFKATCDQLSTIGHPVDLHDQVHWFLCGLGPTFEGFSTTVRAMASIPTFSDLLIRTENHEMFSRSLHGMSSPTLVFSAQQQFPPSNNNRSSVNNRSSSFNQSRGRYGGRGRSRPYGGRGRRGPSCQLCRNTGHYASQCPNLSTYATSAGAPSVDLASAFHAQCSVNSSVPDWTCDTGASTHMLPTTHGVTNPTPTTGSVHQEGSSPRMS